MARTEILQCNGCLPLFYHLGDAAVLRSKLIPAATTSTAVPGGASAAVSQEHQDGVARDHTAELDHAVRDQIGVRVELDEDDGAVAEPVDLARRRERGGADEGEVLVAGDRLLRIDVGEMKHVALRSAVVGDD